MPDIKVQMAPRYCALDVGDTFYGVNIAFTTPNSPQAILHFPDGTPMSTISGFLHDLEARGEIVNDGHGAWRLAHTYRTLGWVHPTAHATYVPGDTFPLLVSDGDFADVQRRGSYGAKRLGHVDTWVDTAHPFLAGKTVAVGNGATPDQEQHGTHTATTACGSAGIASDAQLYTFNGLPGGTGSEALVGQGIRWCADQGCDVISLSLGGAASQVIDDTVSYARQRGCWVVAAAGNDGPGTVIGSPARAATVIALAADRQWRYAWFSEGTQWANPNRLASQGVQIVAGFPGGGTGQMSGTSMATPMVAGLLLLLRAAGLTEQQALAYLFAQAHNRPVAPAPPRDQQPVSQEEAA